MSQIEDMIMNKGFLHFFFGGTKSHLLAPPKVRDDLLAHIFRGWAGTAFVRDYSGPGQCVKNYGANILNLIFFKHRCKPVISRQSILLVYMIFFVSTKYKQKKE